jgi:hypothetical protein
LNLEGTSSESRFNFKTILTGRIWAPLGTWESHLSIFSLFLMSVCHSPQLSYNILCTYILPCVFFVCVLVVASSNGKRKSTGPPIYLFIMLLLHNVHA